MSSIEHLHSNGQMDQFLAGESQPPLDVKLVVAGGRASRQEIRLKLPAVIGRGRYATLLVQHPSVSRSHCEVLQRDGQLLVRDMNSLNGTFVGAEKISESPLKPGDLLTVGPLTFRVEYQQPAASTPPAPSTARHTTAHTRPAPRGPATDDDIDMFLDLDDG